jgi:hypothetical protein
MLYYGDLAKIFPHKINCTKNELVEVVDLLCSPAREDVPYGSSFAVVSGIINDGMMTLWLSEISYRFLVKIGTLPPEGV